MRAFGLLVSLGLLALLGGCTTQYLIPGLTLPHGATVVSQQETKKLLGRVANLPLQDAVKQTVLVNFDDPDGWARVAAHFDIQLNDRGYRDVMSKLETLFGEDNMPPAAPDFAGARMYAKMHSPYVVVLMDLPQMSDAIKPDPDETGDDAKKPGEFYLAVVQMLTPLHKPPPPKEKPTPPAGTPGGPPLPGTPGSTPPAPPPPPPG